MSAPERLDLEACERRIYQENAIYTHIVLREVPLLLAEIKRLRAKCEDEQ